jgi:hypothetical protein
MVIDGNLYVEILFRRFIETMSVTKNVIPFAKATKVKVIDSHTYEVNLENDWCIGTGEFMV